MRKGFSLIEVLVVSLIIGFILSGIASFLIYSNYMNNKIQAIAKTTSCSSFILRQLTTTIRAGEKIIWDDTNTNKFIVEFKNSHRPPEKFEYNPSKKALYKGGHKLNPEGIDVVCTFKDNSFHYGEGGTIDKSKLFAISVKVKVSTKINNNVYENGFIIARILCRNNKINLKL